MEISAAVKRMTGTSLGIMGTICGSFLIIVEEDNDGVEEGWLRDMRGEEINDAEIEAAVVCGLIGFVGKENDCRKSRDPSCEAAPDAADKLDRPIGPDIDENPIVGGGGGTAAVASIGWIWDLMLLRVPKSRR